MPSLAMPVALTTTKVIIHNGKVLILAKYDIDRSGVLEVSEFCRLVDDLRQFQANRQDNVAQIFRAFDADRSSFIESGELIAALRALGLSTDLSEACRVLARYDADGNGRLDLAEFTALVHDLREYHRACSRACM